MRTLSFIRAPTSLGLSRYPDGHYAGSAYFIDWRRLSYAIRASLFDAGLVLVTAFAAVFISVDKSSSSVSDFPS